MRVISSSEIDTIIRAQSPWQGGNIRYHFPSRSLPERRLVDILGRQMVQSAAAQYSRHKVISGPRRVGKTTLLRQLAPRLIEEVQISPEMVVYISMDESERILPLVWKIWPRGKPAELIGKIL